MRGTHFLFFYFYKIGLNNTDIPLSVCPSVKGMQTHDKRKDCPYRKPKQIPKRLSGVQILQVKCWTYIREKIFQIPICKRYTTSSNTILFCLCSSLSLEVLSTPQYCTWGSPLSGHALVNTRAYNSGQGSPQKMSCKDGGKNGRVENTAQVKVKTGSLDTNCLR